MPHYYPGAELIGLEPDPPIDPDVIEAEEFLGSADLFADDSAGAPAPEEPDDPAPGDDSDLAGGCAAGGRTSPAAAAGLMLLLLLLAYRWRSARQLG